MNKKEYAKFRGWLVDTILAFSLEKNLQLVFENGETEEDNGHITILLPQPFGELTVTVESWDAASYMGRVNVLSIPMRFKSFTDRDGIFKKYQGGVNPFNGKFCLDCFTEHEGTLKAHFKEILGMLA